LRAAHADFWVRNRLVYAEAFDIKSAEQVAHVGSFLNEIAELLFLLSGSLSPMPQQEVEPRGLTYYARGNRCPFKAGKLAF
jgi:hypothetical protein